MSSDFAVSVRIVALDNTPLIDLNDHAAGLSVEFVQEPEYDREKVRVTSSFVDGDYTVTERELAGDLLVRVRVEGATWAQCVSRWQAVRDAYRSAAAYYVESEVEGVVTRWRTEQPDSVQGEETTSGNLLLREQTYSIRWHVQPNPSVTIV